MPKGVAVDGKRLQAIEVAMSFLWKATAPLRNPRAVPKDVAVFGVLLGLFFRFFSARETDG